MTEIILDKAKIEAAVGEVKPARMTQHVRPHLCKPGTPRRDREEIIHRLAGERMSALGEEQPRQGIRVKREIAPNGAQFVAGDRLLDRETILQATHPQAGAIEIDLVAAQVGRFAHPQTVPIHHQDEQIIAHAMPPGLYRLKQRGDSVSVRKSFRRSWASAAAAEALLTFRHLEDRAAMAVSP
jgi:hypothetical protein